MRVPALSSRFAFRSLTCLPFTVHQQAPLAIASLMRCLDRPEAAASTSTATAAWSTVRSNSLRIENPISSLARPPAFKCRGRWVYTDTNDREERCYAIDRMAVYISCNCNDCRESVATQRYRQYEYPEGKA